MFNKFIFIFFVFISHSAFSDVLKCNVEPINNTSVKYFNKWINPLNVHVIKNNKIEFINREKTKFLTKDKYFGQILENTEEKLKWRYYLKSKLVRGNDSHVNKYINDKTTYKLTFELRKKTNFAFFDINFKQSFKHNLVDARGKCKYIVESAVDNKAIENKLENPKLSELDKRLERLEKQKKLIEKEREEEKKISLLENKLQRLEKLEKELLEKQRLKKIEDKKKIELESKLARLEKLEKELLEKQRLKKIEDKKKIELESKLVRLEKLEKDLKERQSLNQQLNLNKSDNSQKCINRNFNCEKKNKDTTNKVTSNNLSPKSDLSKSLNIFDPKLGKASDIVNSKKNNENIYIKKCDINLGTIQLADTKQDVLRQLSFFNIPKPKQLLRIIIQKSGCFTIVERGMILNNILLERKLANIGQLQQGSNVGKSQLAASDFILSADLVFTGNTGGGASVGSSIGSLFGPIGAVVGAVAGSVKVKEVQTSIIIVDSRSGIQVTADQGNVSKTDFGFSASMSGLGFSGFANTSEGKLVALALLNNFNNIVENIKNSKELIIPKNKKSIENSKKSLNKVSFAIGDVLSPKISGVKILSMPQKNSKILFKLNKNDEILFLGDKKGGYLLVEGAMGEGWIREIMVKKNNNLN